MPVSEGPAKLLLQAQPKPETIDPKPWTLNPKPGPAKLLLQAQPQPSTLNPKPGLFIDLFILYLPGVAADWGHIVLVLVLVN